MSSYEKFTLDTVKSKLKNGEYASLTGAMRAIGKTQQLNDADKEKARVAARKHFGAEEGAAPKKKAAKKAGKKAAKKVAKKTAAAPKKKASKKAAKAAPKAAPAAKKATRKKASRRAKAAPAPEGDTGASEEKQAPKTPPTKYVEAGSQVGEKSAPKEDRDGPRVVTEMGQVISTVAQSLKAMEAAKNIFPKGQFDRAAEKAVSTLGRAVSVIDKEVVAARVDAEASDAPKVAGGARKKAAKKGTRAKAATTTPPAAEEAEAETEEPEEAPESTVNGAASDLTAEEQEQLELARQTQPH